MDRHNIILNTDSYKISHANQYPPGTQKVYSYLESRGGDYDETLFFGLQMFLKEYLCKPIRMEQIDEAEKVWTAHGFAFDRSRWEYIVNKHGGFLPLAIKSVPEGYVIPTGNVLATVENTDEECWWLTSFIETALLRAVWYPTTVATTSFKIKELIKYFLDQTSDNPAAQLPFKLHDFGGRGVSSMESAGIGGLAHLVNFKGTDTVTALLYGKEYYGEEMAGFSIPASEHSTMTSWGRDHEEDAYRNMIKQFGKPGALFACVSDSYDIFNATKNLWGDKLKQEVIDSGAMVVVRPDSGDAIQTPIKVVEILAEKYGYTVNSKNFKVLNNVRVIQGDGVTGASIATILSLLKARGFSADNIAFGMGGALLQNHTRDSQKFAMKCSAVYVKCESTYRNVSKDPVGDSGKRSKAGVLTLLRENDTWKTTNEPGHAWEDQMQYVYHNGQLLRDISFADVRANSERFLD